MTIKVRAISAVANHLDIAVRDALGAGLRYRGVHGGDHIVTDARGRHFGADLVTGSVSLYVGVPPRIKRWPGLNTRPP